MTLAQFIRLARVRTLTASISPIILGSTFAYYHYPSQGDTVTLILYSLLMLVTVGSAQIAANIWNEYFDYRSGLDTTQVIGNSGSIIREGLSPVLIKQLGLWCTTVTMLTGLYIVTHVSWLLLPLGLFCVGVSYFYSAGPHPLSRTPFGDIASGLTMGFILVYIMVYIWTGTWYGGAFLPALASFLLIASILMTNNIRDLDNDQAHGRRTLAIRLGRRRAITLLQRVIYFVMVWTFLGTIGHLYPWPALVALLALVPGQKVIDTLEKATTPHEADVAMSYMGKCTTLYHLLLSLALFLCS